MLSKGEQILIEAMFVNDWLLRTYNQDVDNVLLKMNRELKNFYTVNELLEIGVFSRPKLYNALMNLEKHELIQKQKTTVKERKDRIKLLPKMLKALGVRNALRKVDYKKLNSYFKESSQDLKLKAEQTQNKRLGFRRLTIYSLTDNGSIFGNVLAGVDTQKILNFLRREKRIPSEEELNKWLKSRPYQPPS